MLTTILLQISTPQDKTGEIDVNPQSIIEKLDSWVDGIVKAAPNILIGILVFIAMLYLGRFLGKIVKKTFINKGRQNFGDLLGGFTRYIVVILGLALSLTIMAPGLSPADLIASLGVSSVAIGFAFQDILQNWLAGILILLRQPFEIGDQIVVNNYEGTVEKIKTRATIIKTYDGKRVVIPNNTVYNNSVVVNTAHKIIRSEYDMGLGYDENYLDAMKILKETIANVEGVSKEKPVETLVWDQADSWLTIRIRWWTKSDRASVVHTRSEVLLKTQQEMNKHGIELPFPTSVEIFKNGDGTNVESSGETAILKSKSVQNLENDN